MNLKDKVIVVTGASSGIGKAVAVEVAKAGGKVVMLARNVARLEKTLAVLVGEEHLFYSIDVTQYEKLEDIISDAVTKVGKISGFVHCAGIEITKPFKSLRHGDYEKIFASNVISGLELARIISKKKYLSSSVSFVFISSVLGFLGKKATVAYCASKAALLSGVKAMALELVSKNIRVNGVSPAIVETEMVKKLFSTLTEEAVEGIVNMHPLGIGKPEDVANVCKFLLSDDARWITGSNVIIDGGYSAH